MCSRMKKNGAKTSKRGKALLFCAPVKWGDAGDTVRAILYVDEQQKKFIKGFKKVLDNWNHL